MKLLHQNFEGQIAELAAEAEEIKVMIAFLTEGGLTWLPEDKWERSEFIVGIDLRITTPGALKSLQEAGARVWIFEEPGRLFHPKAIYLKSEEKEYLVVGSNNLTASGISSNHEISLVVERTVESEPAFAAFLRHFENLKDREGCCFVPDEVFYRDYRPSQIQRDLQNKLESQTRAARSARPEAPPTEAYPSISTLRDFLLRLAQEFELVRSSKPRVKGHPLWEQNEEEFAPLFAEIISKASGGRLTGVSWLSQGGNWRRIPNIFAEDKAHEPHDKVATEGKLIVQVHFSPDYAKVYLSLVLQYSLPDTVKDGAMPDRVARRFAGLREYLEGYSADLIPEKEVFLHWVYKRSYLWSRPLLSKEYPIEALPGDEVLREDLSLLARALNSSLNIQ